MTDGATIAFFPPRFSTFPVDFPKIFFQNNSVLTIANTTKKDLAKSVTYILRLAVSKYISIKVVSRLYIVIDR